MYGQLKIIEHKHSGRLRPHEHTSYLPLAFIVFIVGVVLVMFSFSDVAADHPGPQAGSIGLTGIVPAPPPTEAATITSPANGQHFKTSPVTITGTCPKGTLIEIYKNDIFAGSGPCSDSGTFSFDIDLLFGQNILVARVYDALNQAGPASNSITVYFDSLLPQADPLSLVNLQGAQMLLNTNSVYRGSFPGQNLNVPISIIGGTPPYAINVEWGDTENKVIPRGDNLTFNATHAYQKPGTFAISFQATDSKQRAAFLTVAAIVNGQPGVIASQSSGKNASKLLVLWPLYAIVVTLVVSFWLGERREKRIMTNVIKAKQPLFSEGTTASSSSPAKAPETTNKPPETPTPKETS